MKLTRDDIAHVATLARLDMDDASLDTFAGQVGTILEYIDTLNSVDTEGIAPTFHAISLTNAFRDDIEKPSLDRDAALENAPEKEDGNFAVPKVIG